MATGMTGTSAPTYYTYNRFLDTTIYGISRNLDKIDISGTIVENADSIIQRNLSIGGNLTVGNITLNLGSHITSNGLTITDSQLGYLATISGDIQTQINNLAPISGSLNYAPISGSLNYAPISSPTFTGIPYLTTTPNAGNSSQQIANTAFVTNAITTLNSGLTYAPLASPTFSGIPTAPTAALSTTTFQLSTTAFVQNAISNLSIGNYLTSVLAASTYSIKINPTGGQNNYAPIAAPVFTGIPTAPTASLGTSSLQLSTTAFVANAISNLTIGNYAPLASPIFSGIPTAPTAALSTSTLQISSTAFVQNAISNLSIGNYLTSVLAASTYSIKTNPTGGQNNYAPIAAPVFTGIPTCPTASLGTSSLQLSSTAFVANAITNLNSTILSAVNTWTGLSNTFTGLIYLDSTNLNTEIFNFFSNTSIYGSAGVNLMAGGTTGWAGNTNSLSLNPTSCNIGSALTSGGSITSSNSIISQYLKTYNNSDPSFPSTYALDTLYFQTAFSQTTQSPVATITTSNTLYTAFSIPANYNKSINLSIPIACGINAGSFTNSGTSTITITETISNYNFLIFKDGVLSQTIAATKNSTGILSSQVVITIPSPSSGFFSYYMFLANFSASFTPIFSDVAASYTIFFTSTLTTTTSKTIIPLTVYTGTPYMRYNCSNFTTSTTTLTNCSITPMYGTGGSVSTISTSENTNTAIGTTYVNNLTSANPIALSYSVLPTLFSNQIGYSAPISYYNGTAVTNGSFVILAKTTGSLPIGNHNVFWTTALANTVGNGTINVGMYGVILAPTATSPTSFSGSSYTEVHNQTAYNNQNQLYTSSAFVSPATANYSVYLCVNIAFINTVMTTSSLSNLQVIRTS